MRRTERGMTLAEVLISLAILSGIVIFSARLVTTALQTTRNNVNKQFATQKALSMLEELRGLVQRQDGATTIVLDAFDDGVSYQPILTTQTAITDPGHVASANRFVGGRWLFSRRITVQRFPGSSDLRLVNVKVFINEALGPRLLAEVASVLSTIGGTMPPTQVYDTYLIAIENIPGWWVYMQNVVPFVESAMNDLESRHPGLQFRRHWIRKLSYGRDPLYMPLLNRTADSTQPIDSVYFYPGLLPSGYPVQFYYPPDFFNARLNIDGTVTNGFDATDNPSPYALADQYNHSMRYPDELALFQARVA
jgi:prepilin-type N-terminal cleavage/methylation domain-containing protein